jgi:hypothetical protein
MPPKRKTEEIVTEAEKEPKSDTILVEWADKYGGDLGAVIKNHIGYAKVDLSKHLLYWVSEFEQHGKSELGSPYTRYFFSREDALRDDSARDHVVIGKSALNIVTLLDLRMKSYPDVKKELWWKTDIERQLQRMNTSYYGIEPWLFEYLSKTATACGVLRKCRGVTFLNLLPRASRFSFIHHEAHVGKDPLISLPPSDHLPEKSRYVPHPQMTSD